MECERIILSIRPRFARKILGGEKRYELRRVRPALEPGTVVYVYSTAPDQAIIGEFLCGKVHAARPADLWQQFGRRSSVTREEFDQYFVGLEMGYAIEIGGVRSWRKELSLQSIRKTLSSFRPPRFYRRVNGDERLAHLLARQGSGVVKAVPAGYSR